MLGRLKLVIVASAAAMTLAPATVAAQDGGRFRVLIPYFEPLQGSDDDFGRDASEELRDLVSTLPTHQAMERRDIEDEADEFGIDMDDLNCTRAIQLASTLGVQVVVCARYTEDQNRNRTVNASITTVANQEEFRLEEFSVGRDNGDEQAAQQIFAQFSRFNDQVRATQFCGDYAASTQWEDALRQCDAALAINADATSTRFLRGQILRNLERQEEALEEMERVLAADPIHELALQEAGFLATTLGEAESGRDYYRQYLDINPGNVAIRMRIAYEIAQAGDPVGAMQFIEVGLEVEPENADLNEQYANFAFAAAQSAQSAHELNGGEGLAPEAAEHYRAAIVAFMTVFAVRGAEMDEGRLRNILAAHIQLEEYDQATAKGQQFLEAHPRSANLWSIYADALQRTGRLDEAIGALDRVLEIEPSHPSAALRQGTWLIQAERIDEAVAKLQEFVAQNPNQADQAARQLFADGYNNGFREEDYAYAIRGFAAAKQIPGLGETLTRQINFWHAFSLYSQIAPVADQQTLQSAQATQPRVQEALRLLADVRPYTQTQDLPLDQVLTALQQYLDINQMIIDRGR
jgi:tetratricopeptide (TPR) repeat protein